MPYTRLTTKNKSLARSRSAAFTLIELLVVIAITAVLIGLVFQPLLYGFQFTSQAQAITEAQDAARVTMEQVSREIGSAAAVRDTTGQYLDMRLFTPTGNDEILGHAYNAYIDIVPARTGVQSSTIPTVADPTVNPYASTSTGAGFYLGAANNTTTTTNGVTVTTNEQPSLVSSPVTLPISPGTTIVRYFIGLSRPFNLTYTGTGNAEEEPYINRDENQVPNASSSISGGNNWPATYDIVHGLNNPYILYRAEVSPYKIVAGGTYEVNSDLFDTQTSATGVKTPVLDDPDFFRITGDAAHNARVYHWFQAAKPVIASGDANLIFQAHNNYGVVQYADVNANTAYPNNGTSTLNTVSLSAGTALDANGYPIVRTSVSFAPATVSNQPLSPTSTSDVAQGYGSAPTDATVPYIPTQYAAQSGQWSGNQNLLITENAPASGTAGIFNTYDYNPVKQSDIAAGRNPGDLIEAQASGSDSAVFNVTQGLVIPNTSGNAAAYPNDYVVFSVAGNGGTLNFSTPDLPLTMSFNTDGAPSKTEVTAVTSSSTGDAFCGNANVGDPNNPFWFCTFNNSYSGTSYGEPSGSDILQIHLKPQPQLSGYSQGSDQVLIPNPALGGNSGNELPNIAYAPNARVVVNSERVYGPDESAGAITTGVVAANTQPANYPVVLYSRIPFNIGQVGSIGANQYMIDYDYGIIYLGAPKSAGGPIDISQSSTSPQSSTVLVAFNYQNNAVIPVNMTTNAIDATQLASGVIAPDTVRATYQTNSRIEVAVGVRLYDAQSGHPIYFSLANAVNVGNSNR